MVKVAKLTLFVILLFVGKMALAQGGEVIGVAQYNQAGYAKLLSGATATICTYTGSLTCGSPLTQYSNETLTTPVLNGSYSSSDGNGNYNFFITPGSYVVKVHATGYTDFLQKVTVGVTVSYLASALVPIINGEYYVACGTTDMGVQINTILATATAGQCEIKMVPGSCSYSTGIVLNKQCRLAFAGHLTYTGPTAALSVTADGSIVEGDGRGNTTSTGTYISVTNTATKGINVQAQAVKLRDLELDGPGSGTGIGVDFTSNNGQLDNVRIYNFGGNCVTIDGTRGNSNNVSLRAVRGQGCKAAGVETFGADANVVTFDHTDFSSNSVYNYKIGTSDNVCVGCHAEGAVNGTNYYITGALFGTAYSEEASPVTVSVNYAGGNGSWLNLMNGTTVLNTGTYNNSWKAAGRNEGSFDWGMIMPADPSQQFALKLSRTTNGTTQSEITRLGAFFKSASAQTGGLIKADGALNIIYGASGTAIPIFTIAANCTDPDITTCTKTWTGNADGTSTFGKAVTFSSTVNVSGNMFLAANFTPSSAGGSSIGLAALPFPGAYIGGAATNNIHLHGTATAARDQVLPDDSGNVVLSSTNSVNHASCWKTATAIGYCSDVVSASGTCTCN